MLICEVLKRYNRNSSASLSCIAFVSMPLPLKLQAMFWSSLGLQKTRMDGTLSFTNGLPTSSPLVFQLLTLCSWVVQLLKPIS